ncbi:Amylo-alpha-16-glucosidase [Ammonifex degensii KC4]|uniref:Amylo-alpha-16-glucosidase n=1 Tax=Ammonifex degensii (strain DSM 10501 / KC4) TaxID=429009 RepID=C9R8E5_AMMDK|nr:amylo-alpha-1,6-glucosidase [Ammonifex degensii]ACX52574.1 Amylo-alpha-16-glucosidase [Ammonifex degensii KC4]
MQLEDSLRIAPASTPGVTEVLKNNDLFLVSLPDSSIPAGYPGGLGLYFRDTRFLSRHELFINGREPVLLSSGVRFSHFCQCDLTNPELRDEKGAVLAPMESLHLRLLRFLNGSLYQRLRVTNYGYNKVALTLTLKLGADFRDIFELRGVPRRSRGTLLPFCTGREGLVFRYRGLDELTRRTTVIWDPPPADIFAEGDDVVLTYRFELEPKERVYFYWRIMPEIETVPESLIIVKEGDLRSAFTRLAAQQKKAYYQWYESCTRLESDRPRINQMFNQALSDLWILQTRYPEGTGIDAGIPWYATLFGRDALITAWQTLAINPDLARETLRLLAHYQGKTVDPVREEEPGKIIHEIRRGEMANCREILHTPYYGSIDSTLWFIIVLGDYIIWTKDLTFLEEMRPALEAALEWCYKYGDKDGDGYIEYEGSKYGGLQNQGWKDSWDGVPDPEGKPVKPPIALVEVQGYLYAAYRRASHLFNLLKEREKANFYARKATELRRRFLKDFWVKKGNYLGLALDGDKRLIPTVASNMGQVLFTGILPPQKARQVADRLFARDMFSGWGIRTLSRREKAYNPISYHNGSVWPHDNSIIAVGLRRYGFLKELEELASSLYDAALRFPYFRLPELFCGFDRRPFASPIRYPVACEPQAWATGSIFLLLQACLGLKCTPEGLLIQSPLLPAGIQELYLCGLRVQGAKVGLEFVRRNGHILCFPTRREGDLKITIET